MLIDSHHHLWAYNNTDYGWMTGTAMNRLRRNYLIPELQEIMRDANVKETIAVQARQMTEETEWLLDLATHHPFIRGVVGWVPLTDPDVEKKIERFSGHRKLKAVRHVLHDEPDDFYMMRDDFSRGIQQLLGLGLVYDILIFERQLPQTIMFVDRHPNQVFVLDHMGKPRIRERLLTPWRENIVELAKRSNVFCKVSGITTEGSWNSWTTEDVRPYFDVVLEAFGPRRLMFGSDWPVVTLAGGYKRWSEAFHSLIAGLSTAESILICSGTAIEAYNL